MAAGGRAAHRKDRQLMIAILGRVHAFSEDEEMRRYPDRIEFGPARIQRLAAFFVLCLVVVGGVSLKLSVHHENLHFALALMFPPLLGFTIALGGDWMRPPTALTATDIRFCPRDALFQIIPSGSLGRWSLTLRPGGGAARRSSCSACGTESGFGCGIRPGGSATAGSRRPSPSCGSATWRPATACCRR
ncbi:MAG: hypothetical protein BUE48_012340 [Thermomonospora sp. CIF 1]|nr:MAG: hypothetical protein BUE48_012340 [Thermomonospora sp. CIF 1]